MPSLPFSEAPSGVDPELARLLGRGWREIARLADLPGDERGALEWIEDLGSQEVGIGRDYAGRYPIELLQNAHDACADIDQRGDAWIQVTKRALIVGNQGAPFDGSRLRALTRIGASDKDRATHHTIGYKGIGFTSVFEISDSPQILSRDVRFSFSRERAGKEVASIVGEELRSVPARYFPFELTDADLGADGQAVTDMLDEGAVTVIRLPFSSTSASEVVATIEDALAPEVLLFMQNLRALHLRLGTKSVSWTKRVRSRSEATSIYSLKAGDQSRGWVVAEARMPVATDLVAQLNDDMWAGVKDVQVMAAIPWSDGKPDPTRGSQPLHVYFPTDDRSARSVLIHGDFYTDSNRKHLQTKGAGGELNRLLLARGATLVGDMAEGLAEFGRPLLECLAAEGSSSGSGADLDELIDSELKGRHFLLTATAAPPGKPEDMYRLGTGLPLETEQRLLLILEDLDDVTNPTLDKGSAVTLLESLDVDEVGTDWIADSIRTPGDDVKLDAVLSALQAWIESLPMWEVNSVVSKLRTKPILQDIDGNWRTPQHSYLHDPAVARLPISLDLHPVKKPRAPAVQKLFETLRVTALDEGAIIRQLLKEAGSPGLAADRYEAIFEFLAKAWRRDDSVFDDMTGLGVVRVRARKWRGSKVEWVRADGVFFSPAWTGDEAIARCFGPLGETEFLADEPPTSAKAKRQWTNFLERLGVRKEPRLVEIRSFQGTPEYARWRYLDEVTDAERCPKGHPQSGRALVGTVLERLPSLLQNPTRQQARALAEVLARAKDPYGSDVTVRCLSSTHAGGKNLGRAIGFQRWLLETNAWIPVTDDPTGASFRPPSEAWYDFAKSHGALALPRAQLEPRLAKALRLVNAQRPAPSAIVSALDDLASEDPALHEADVKVQDTAHWLLRRLESVIDVDEPPPAPEFPATEGGVPAWSTDPVVADLEGLEHLTGLEVLATGDWASIREAFGLKLASEVVDISPKFKRVEAGTLMPMDRREVLLVLLHSRRGDLERLCELGAGLREVSTDRLELVLQHGGDRTVVQRTHHLRVRRRNGVTEGAELIYVPGASHLAMARDLARYFGTSQSPELICRTLEVSVASLRADYNITDSAIEEVRDLLKRRRLAEPDAERADGEQHDGESGDGEAAPALDDEQEATSAGDNRPAPSAQTPPSRTGGDGQSRSGDGSASDGTPADRERDGQRGDDESSSRTRRDGSGEPGQPSTSRLPVYVATGESDEAGRDNGHRTEVEQAGVEFVLGFERDQERDPEEMPRNNPGFDIISRGSDGSVRYIEVKASSGPWGAPGVALTRTEFEKAAEVGESYWLYVVENALTDAKWVHRIQDPARRANQYVFDGGWRALGEGYDD